uniref:Elongation of very long chain fatty acids protein n=1 Tax=Cacopsylla melanoneura TaxID=428564 RepID=A0A8D8XYU8_9HEMI
MEAYLPDWIMTRIQAIKDEIHEDKRVDNWFLVQSWIPVTSIVMAYLVFVNYLGPRMMRNRPAYNIKYIMLVYNLIQTLMNAQMLTNLPGTMHHLIRCTPSIFRDPELKYQNFHLWILFNEMSHRYYLIKLLDLLDTVFFVLRKKQSHVTFLHVYHHSLMVMAIWFGIRYLKAEQGIVLGAINCVVHVVMYSYYFLAALGPSVRKYLWWKKYLTILQLIQFILIGVHALCLIIFRCPMPVMFITYFILLQAIVMCILFGNFYYQSYVKKKSDKLKEALD